MKLAFLICLLSSLWPFSLHISSLVLFCIGILSRPSPFLQLVVFRYGDLHIKYYRHGQREEGSRKGELVQVPHSALYHKRLNFDREMTAKS